MSEPIKCAAVVYPGDYLDPVELCPNDVDVTLDETYCPDHLPVPEDFYNETSMADYEWLWADRFEGDCD